MTEEAQALDELFDPPAGYHLTAGFLVTYDLAVTALVETVLARLAGAQPHERYEIGLSAPELTVAYERLHAGPMIPSWHVELVRCPAGEARPLHAKGGLLRFEPEDGRRRTLLRGWVGSANITAGGLQRNHELVLAGESPLGQPNLAVSQAMQLCDAVAEVAGPLAKTRLGSVVPARQRRRRSGEQLLHTIDEHRALLAGVPVPAGLHRLDIVTPLYQARDSGAHVAKALEPILPDVGGQVHIYTSTDLENIEEGAHHVATFPASLSDTLRDTYGLEVTAHFLPEVIDGQRRRLHAKAYVLHGDTKSVVLVGSANATRSGLLGNNREALAVHRLEPAAAAQWLHDHLTAKCWTGLSFDERGLDAGDRDVQQGDDLAGSYAELSIPDDAEVGPDGRWVGRLTLRRLPAGRRLTVYFEGSSVTATVNTDGELDVSALLDDEPFALLPHEGVVKVEDQQGVWHDVVVFAHASAEWYAKEIERRDRPPRPRTAREVHELERLLASLRRSHQPTPPGTPRPAGETIGADDRLSLPLDRRFDLVAKFAARYALATDEELRHYLEIGDEFDPRHEVIRAIRTARSGTQPGLLGALQRAVQDVTRGPS
jgi:hypothetical protein